VRSKAGQWVAIELHSFNFFWLRRVNYVVSVVGQLKKQNPAAAKAAIGLRHLRRG
jgi:hypothetical protein